MPIKLPEQPILTAEQVRDQYVAQHAKIVAGVRKAIEELCVHNRQAYEDHLYNGRVEHIQKFLDSRKSNQLICEGTAGLIRNEIKRLAELPKQSYFAGENLRKLIASAQESLHWISQYTTHPVRITSLKAINDLPYFEQEAAREKDKEWIYDENRPAFAVHWMKNGKEKIRAEVHAEVERAVQNFIRKTVDKVADILIAKNGDYVCELKGQFSIGVLEGDLYINFPDKTGFRTHIILKTNYSVLGNPYFQYPLTFHDVISETGGKPEAMLSEEEICKALGVPKWEAPAKQKKPWNTVKIGDVVLVNKKTFVCRALVLGTRGTTANVHYLDGVEEKIDGTEITKVLARTTCDTWHEHHVRVEPFDGKVFKVNPKASTLGGSYESGPKIENIMRVGCLDEIFKGLN